jgi:tRNA A64-2'-O-ribosylphosphate transferase
MLVQGLEPDMFWTYRAELMQVSRRELYQLVQSVTSTAKDESTAKSSISFKPSAIAHVNSRIRICALRDMPELPPTQLPGPQSLDDALNDVAYVLIDSDCSSDGGDSVQPASDTTLPILCLRLNEGKRGQDQFLRIVLPSTLPFIGKHLQEGKSVVIACSSGKDASVGVAVAAMQRYFNDDGHYSSCAQIGASQRLISVSVID